MNNRVPAAAAVFACTMYFQSPPRGRAVIETPVNALRSPEVNADRTVTLRFRLDLFASIGLFSPAIGSVDLVRDYDGKLATANRLLRLLWIGIGGSDAMFFPGVQKMHEELERAGIRHVRLESDGAHTWTVWGKYLADFAPGLFR